MVDACPLSDSCHTCDILELRVLWRSPRYRRRILRKIASLKNNDADSCGTRRIRKQPRALGREIFSRKHDRWRIHVTTYKLNIKAWWFLHAGNEFHRDYAKQKYQRRPEVSHRYLFEEMYSLHREIYKKLFIINVLWCKLGYIFVKSIRFENYLSREKSICVF